MSWYPSDSQQNRPEQPAEQPQFDPYSSAPPYFNPAQPPSPQTGPGYPPPPPGYYPPQSYGYVQQPPPGYGQPYGYYPPPTPGYGPLSAMPTYAPPRRPAISGVVVFLVFLAYFIGLCIAANFIAAVGGISLYYGISFLAAVGATIETVQRRRQYGNQSASHPVVIFILLLLMGAVALSLYLTDFHRFQSRKSAGWYNNLPYNYQQF